MKICKMIIKINDEAVAERKRNRSILKMIYEKENEYNKAFERHVDNHSG